jgi:hypothetical protein
MTGCLAKTLRAGPCHRRQVAASASSSQASGPWRSGEKTLSATMHSNAKLRPRISVLAAQVGLAVEPSRPTQASNACSVSSSPTNRPLSLVATLHGLGMLPSAFPATRLTPRMGSSLQDERHLHGHPIFIDLSIFCNCPGSQPGAFGERGPGGWGWMRWREEGRDPDFG